MRTAFLCLLTMGCGRIDFDPRAGGDASTLADAMPCTFGPWSTPRLQAAASSSSTEYSPALSADGLTLLFESDRVGSGGFDLWATSRSTVDADFGAASPAGAVNTPNDERGPTLSTDGLTLYLSRGPASTGGELFRAQRATTADPFGAAVPVAELAGMVVNGPSLSASGDELFFSQGANLYHAQFDGATFGNVTAISELNTAAVQGYPSISGDGLELYFETQRTDNFDDVWVGRRTAIGAAFTSTSEVDAIDLLGSQDSDPEISHDGRTMILVSDRGTAGEFDLYVSTRACQ